MLSSSLLSDNGDGGNNNNVRLLFVLDGYDELQPDITPQNLWSQLGLDRWFDGSKLIVSCRRHIVPKQELVSRFGVNGDGKSVKMSYLLPFNLSQMMEYLQKQLDWNQEIRKEYQQTLENASVIRGVLRNPFVLNLFVESWPVIHKLSSSSNSSFSSSSNNNNNNNNNNDEKEKNKKIVSPHSWNGLKRNEIYRSFLEHWLLSYSSLLHYKVKSMLLLMKTNEKENGIDSLVCSYIEYSGKMAALMFLNKTVTLSPLLFNQQQRFISSSLPPSIQEEIKSTKSSSRYEDDLIQELIKNPWFHLKESTKTESLLQFQNQQKQQSNQQQQRRVLQEESYIQLQIAKLQQFQKRNPLQQRQNEYGFVHRSFLEYLVSQHLSNELIQPYLIPSSSSSNLSSTTTSSSTPVSVE